MKVSLVFTRYRPPFFRGGIERYVDEVGKRLIERNIDCEIVAFEESLSSNARVPARYVRVVRGLPFAPVVSFALQTLGFWQRYDRVVVQYGQLGMSIPSDRLYCVVHTTCIGEARSLERTGAGIRSRLERLAMQTLGARLEQRTFRRARALIAISEAIKQELVTHYGIPAARISVIGNAVDCRAFHPRPAPATQRTGLRLLCVGRLVPRKNVPALLAALSLCDRTVSCAIVGEGPQGDALRRLASSLGLEGRVEFRGFQQAEALERSYQDADALVMPSVYEGMPMAILEAKASGLPTVAVDFEGARSLIPATTGIVLDDPSPAALAGAFELLLHDRARLVRLGAAARQDALERFDWDIVLSQLIDELALR